MNDELEPRRAKLAGPILVGIAVVVLLVIYPSIYLAKGYRFARFAARNGISVDVSAKVDGIGFGAKASQDALQKKVEFNAALYDRMTAGTYLRDEQGVGEGLSGYFFGVGSRLGRAP